MVEVSQTLSRSSVNLVCNRLDLFAIECADVDNIRDVIAAITGEVLANPVHEITPIPGVKLAAANTFIADIGLSGWMNRIGIEGEALKQIGLS